jgi:hypothetical protein
LSLDVDSVASVLNRVTTIVPPAFLRSSPRDRDYAAAEIQALIASWLHGLRCPVINPIGGEGPIANLTQRQWLARALDVGIPVARTLIATSPRILSPDQAAFVGRPLGQTVDGWSPIHSVADIGPPFTTVVVAGQRVHGGFEPGLAGACAELARAMGCPLLELRFGTTDAGLVLLGVEQAPALASAASVAAVAELLVRLRATPEVRR